MKKISISFGLVFLFGTLAFAQDDSKLNSVYVRQEKIYNALKNTTLTSVNHCNNKRADFVTKGGKILRHGGKIVMSEQPKCMFEIFGVEIKSTHPDSLNKNLSFVELKINYSIKTNSQLPDTLSFKFFIPNTEIGNNKINKKSHFDKELIISESQVSGVIINEIKVKDFINGQYLFLFDDNEGETHEFDFELNIL